MIYILVTVFSFFNGGNPTIEVAGHFNNRAACMEVGNSLTQNPKKQIMSARYNCVRRKL